MQPGIPVKESPLEAQAQKFVLGILDTDGLAGEQFLEDRPF